MPDWFWLSMKLFTCMSVAILAHFCCCFAQEAKEQEWLDLFKAAGLGRLQTAAKLIKTGVNMNRKDEVCDHLSIHIFIMYVYQSVSSKHPPGIILWLMCIYIIHTYEWLVHVSTHPFGSCVLIRPRYFKLCSKTLVRFPFLLSLGRLDGTTLCLSRRQVGPRGATGQFWGWPWSTKPGMCINTWYCSYLAHVQISRVKWLLLTSVCLCLCRENSDMQTSNS